MNIPLFTAPTYHERYVQAKIEHDERTVLAIRQKRAVKTMQAISICDSINMTDNAVLQHSMAEERIKEKQDRDDHYILRKQR